MCMEFSFKKASASIKEELNHAYESRKNTSNSK